jgi:predicted nucleotidyltransferase
MSVQKDIIQLSKELYNATAVILVGSRAVGDYYPESDWDVMIFSPLLKKKEVGREYSRALREKRGGINIPGVTVDTMFFPSSIQFSFQVFDKKLRYARVLYDAKGRAKSLMIDAKRFYKKGPTILTQFQVDLRRRKCEGYVTKMQHLLKAKKYYELAERCGWFLNEMIVPYWFDLRGEWDLRPQQTMAHIQKRDLLFYRWLQRFVGECNYRTKVGVAKKMIEVVFLHFNKM